MKVVFKDFNGAGAILEQSLAVEWGELSAVLATMPLHLKPSDQAGKQGSAIFDPVSTNAAIKLAMKAIDWGTNTKIPRDYNFLGKDVDFLKSGLLVEAQFSNYPFFLNNIVRSALLSKSKALLGDKPVDAVVIVTKAHMFPSSNSTLYYEQAVNQMSEFAKHGVFDVPVRIVGLFEEVDVDVNAVWVTFPARYGRENDSSEEVTCRLSRPTSKRPISQVEIIRPRR